jgi:ribonuclease HI
MKHVELIADGSCLSRPTGPGGWACILRYKNTERVLTGGAPVTTSNQMELKAVTMGLRALTERCEVLVVTDSKYVQQGLQMLPIWDRTGCGTAVAGLSRINAFGHSFGPQLDGTGSRGAG